MGLQKWKNKLSAYGKLVMFSHTIFSLSFAVVSMLLAAGGMPELRVCFWILVCFLGARTGANALNRVIDAEIDAKNPRTAQRQLPRGELKKGEVLTLAAGCLGVMLAGAWQLNAICFALAPAALVLLVGYSYCKRFTWLCHLVLGASCACAPVGAWLAVTGRLSLLPLCMGAANMLWVAGFDVIYGSQDCAFDRENGLYSIPVRFGVKNGLKIALGFHLAAVLLLILAGVLARELGAIYHCGVLVIAGLLAAQYRMVTPEDLTRVNMAAYRVNQLVSFTLLVFGTADALL